MRAMKYARFLLLPAFALALAACEEKAPAVEPEFGEKVRAYLLENPEVLQEVIARLEHKQVVERIDRNRTALERDGRDFVANPKGEVTVVEFFDYNCGYCKVIAPEVVELIEANPDVRFVFKDMTIFGPTSEYAAAAARQVKGSGEYLDVHKAMMAAKPLDVETVGQILTKHGGDPAAARKIQDSEAQRDYLADVHTLAEDLGIQGTPAFVVGDMLIPGADANALRQAIVLAKKG